ncbi:hypothetical protein HYX17_02400 [Candidatus Woesearchaeota archaeon]|nr:hypothetical protein [Candidatus Woesearchaeota archaeon]
MKERELLRFYRKYINKDLYHVVSLEYINDIKEEGLNPKKDPYQKLIPDIKRLFKLILRLEKKKFIHKQNWGFKIVTAKYIVKTSLKDINSPFIDFTPLYKETYYYRRHRGGALVTTIKAITYDILKRKPELTKSEFDLVNMLYKWSIKKSKFKNKVLVVKGSSRCFETAHFQRVLSGKRYIKSPFGRFEHFKKVINGYGFERYEHYLKEKKLFYLRVIDKIPASDIKIRN